MKKYEIIDLEAGLMGMGFAHHYERKTFLFEKEPILGSWSMNIANKDCKIYYSLKKRFENDCGLFLNADHLNVKGAIKFTQILLDELKDH